MGPNRQRRKREPVDKKPAAAGQAKKKAPSLVSSAARNLIADVLHHAVTGGSVPVSEKHFNSTLGTRITLQRNSQLSSVEILSRVYEGLGFPQDLVTQYVSDLMQAGDFPAFESVEDLLAIDGAFQPFLVQSCFELFDCITQFRRYGGATEDDTLDGASFNSEVGDQILEDEVMMATEMFEEQYIGKKNFNDDAADDREAYFVMESDDKKKILIAVRFPSYYPQDPPMLFIQPMINTKSSGKTTTLLVAPKCTKDLPAAIRRSIIDAAIEVINAFPQNGCLVPLLSSIHGMISSLVVEKKEVQVASPVAPSQTALDVQRKEFLKALQDLRDPNAVSDDGTTPKPQIVIPERVQLATVDVSNRDLPTSQTGKKKSYSRDSKVDTKLADNWETLRRSGALKSVRESLPAFQARKELRDALSISNVVVIGGETGSGKTTQIPQYLYEFFCEEGRGSVANIICTQPRRLAATSVALRVAEERDDVVGGMVGYSIRLENCTSSQTQITYCTTGIVLRRLQTDKYLNGVSHVVVDEIHERGVDTDFLLILLKDLLERRKDLIVVLMSATMDSELFSHYFGGAPVLSIHGRTFPVQAYHLEDIIPMVGYHLESGSPYESRDVFTSSGDSGKKRNARMKMIDEGDDYLEELKVKSQVASKISGSPETIDVIARMNMDVINYEIVESIVVYIDQRIRTEGAVLVFLPGMAEIQNCLAQLQGNHLLQKKCIFYNLHSSLGSADQQGVFARPPKGKRKVILGTNIMETSITIDDAVYVIDCGKVKENRYNARKSMSELVTVNTSKANCRQRQGRAGRVREGFCFRLFTSVHFETMDDHQLCEMHRVSLDSLILQIYSLNLGDEMEYLQKALSPPEEKAITSSVKVLVTLGALTKEKRLTSLGQHLANLPLDVRVGKMIIHSALLHCVDPVLTMAACLSARSPFLASFELRAEVEGMRRAFSSTYPSDQLSSWFAYCQWISTLKEKGAGAARKLCEEAYLSPNSLSQIQSTKRQYEQYLFEAGFLDGETKPQKTSSQRFLFPPHVSLSNDVYEAGGSVFNQNSGSVLCLMACLVAGLYPNIARVKTRKKPEKTSFPTTRKPASRYITFDGSDCLIHPSSVTSGSSKVPTVLVTYVDKVKTSDVFLRDVSVVSPLHVILFGGGKLEYLAKYQELCVDEVMAFQIGDEEATLLMHFKDQLQSALTTKINNPSITWESVSSVVVRAIVKLLNDNSSSGRGIQVIDRRQPREQLTDSLLPAASEAASEKNAKKCFHCGEAGHLVPQCPHRLREKEGGPSTRCFICGSWHFPLHCPLAKKVTE